jgi:membrane-associated phospholipid phosphatase
MHLPILSPLNFFGGILILVALFYIVGLVKDQYFSRVTKLFIHQLRANKWVLAILFILVLGEIKFIDLPLSAWCKMHFQQNIYAIFDYLNVLGEGWFLGGSVFAGILIFDYLQQKSLAKILRIALTSLICSGILNTILKCVFNRERPGIAMQQWHFFHFFQTGATNFGQLIYASNSMPSGHTIAVFATITPLLIYLQKFSLRLVLVGFALIICWARIYTLNHWLSDVTVATMLGIMIGMSTYKANMHKINN